MCDCEFDETPCPRCGAVPTRRIECCEPGCEDGWIDLYAEDPIYYLPGERQRCPSCRGLGFVHWCSACGQEM